MEGISLDEAFLDVGGARRLFGPAPDIAAAVRRRIRDEVGLGCSVGVAPSKLLAKLASKQAKPRASLSGVVEGPGVVVVRPGEELAFLHPMPVGALWGVGPRTADKLRAKGVGTVGDLAAVPRATVVEWLGPAAGTQLWELAWARDARPVEPSRPPKSVGHEETFAVDLRERADLHREVVRQSDAVAARLRGAGLAGRTVTVKVRFNDFATITRSRTPSPSTTRSRSPPSRRRTAPWSPLLVAGAADAQPAPAQQRRRSHRVRPEPGPHAVDRLGRLAPARAADAQLQLACLLYTSPSPRD